MDTASSEASDSCIVGIVCLINCRNAAVHAVNMKHGCFSI